jgi:hypothetical protein
MKSETGLERAGYPIEIQPAADRDAQDLKPELYQGRGSSQCSGLE